MAHPCNAARWSPDTRSAFSKAAKQMLVHGPLSVRLTGVGAGESRSLDERL